MTKQLLTPEQQRAYAVFEEMLNHWQDYLVDVEQLTVSNICVKNSRISTYIPLKTKTLPRGVDWLWNQSRSRQNVAVNGVQVCFYKLNTRKVRKSEMEAPPYKIWIFNALFPNFQQVSFLWCERGDEPLVKIDVEFIMNIDEEECVMGTMDSMECNDGATEMFHQKFAQTIEEFIAPVSLNDLYFLRPFASPTCALYWS